METEIKQKLCVTLSQKRDRAFHSTTVESLYIHLSLLFNSMAFKWQNKSSVRIHSKSCLTKRLCLRKLESFVNELEICIKRNFKRRVNSHSSTIYCKLTFICVGEIFARVCHMVVITIYESGSRTLVFANQFIGKKTNTFVFTVYFPSI